MEQLKLLEEFLVEARKHGLFPDWEAVRERNEKGWSFGGPVNFNQVSFDEKELKEVWGRVSE